MARNETGKMIRCRPGTLARFQALLQRLTIAYMAGADMPWVREADQGITADQLLNRLMDVLEGHAARVTASRKRTAARRREAALAEVVVPVGVALLDDGTWSRFGQLPRLPGVDQAADQLPAGCPAAEAGPCPF